MSSFFPPDRESTQRGTDRSVQRLPFERCEIRLTFYLAKKKGNRNEREIKVNRIFPLIRSSMIVHVTAAVAEAAPSSDSPHQITSCMI